MTVLGFHGGSHCRAGHAETLRNAGAHETFEDMRQLPALIAQNQTLIAGFSAS
jgi:beta-phosphoglucomutase-like phosphatase (HAD superfamily)